MRGISMLMALAVWIGLAAATQAQDAPPSGDLKLIVTYGSGPAWHPLNPPDELDGMGKFTKAVKTLADENPDAVFVDLGGFTAPQSLTETAYNARNARFYYDNNFAAVNATAEDYFQFAANVEGMRQRPPRYEKLFLSSLDHSEERRTTPLPAHKVAETKQGNFELMSIADINNVSGVPLVIERAVQKLPENVIQEALQEKSGPAILFSDYTPQTNDELARSYPDIDLILETAEGPATPRKIGGTFIQPRGGNHEIQVLTIGRAPNNRFASVQSKRVPWITPEEYDTLVQAPLPIIGMSVPGQGRVAERLNIQDQNVDLEVFRGRKFPELTAREDVYVYHVVKDGKKYRVMRVHHNFARGWIQLDGLALMNPDHTIAQLETNDPYYSIIYFPTQFQDVLNAIYNKPVEQWQVPQEAIAGYAGQANIVLDTLRKAIEIDKQFYPDTN